MDKMDGNGLDLVNSNIEKLKELFPETVSEDKIDFDLLRSLLGDYAEVGEESYSFEWPGRSAALKFANTPSSGTLIPSKDKSKNWETTSNIYIEGDNCEVLKILSKTYHNKIKMIYIDPPYNTGTDFIYEDSFVDSIENYLKITGQTSKTNPETSGRFHTKWLNMMLPRLYLASHLLKDDGFCFIHIDEHEDYNLRKLCRFVFGEGNELGVIVWDKRNPKGDTVGVAYQHESILVYAKNKNAIQNKDFTKKKENANEILKKAEDIIKTCGGVNAQSREMFKKWMGECKDRFTGGELAYCMLDDDGNVFRPVSMAAPDKPETRSHRPLIHPVTGQPCPVPEKGWRFKDETMDEMLANGQIVFGPDHTTQPQNKYYLKNNLEEMFSSIIYYGGSDDACGLPFDNPKPVCISKKLIYSVCKNDDDIVMDFFSGSGTTAHAVFELNAEDGIKRKFVLVQLPELVEEKHRAKKEGFNNLCELGEKRLCIAGDLVLEKAEREYESQGLFAEEKKNPVNLDFGFKVFELASSNILPWDGTKKLDELNIFEQNEVFKEGRTKLDVAYEVMLKYGVFDKQLEEKKINGKDVFCVDNDSLVIFLEDEIDMDDVKEIIKLNPTTVVFKEAGFADDNVKMNAEYTLRHYLGEDQIKVLCI